MTNKFTSDQEEIKKLLSSPHYLKLADSILTKVDRNTLAEIIAGYLYFKSKGRKDSEFARFIMAEKFPEILFIAMQIGIPVILPALITDKKFRSLILDAAISSIFKSKN